MLARHAESLFWTGRYIERAEDTARLLDVTYHSQLQAMPWEAADAWTDVLSVLQLDGVFAGRGTEPGARAVGEFLVFDRGNPGAIVSAVERARENARSVRELISIELWEALNTFHLALQERDLPADLDTNPHALYGMVRTRCQTIAGVALQTLPRDEGWSFLQLGWMLERAEMTCRLLAVRFNQLVAAGTEEGLQHWLLTLRSAAGLEAFRRSYQASTDPADVVEFLLLSSAFPRSVLFSLRSAARALAALDPRAGRPSRPQRLLGRTAADLEYAAVGELLAGDLTDHLDRLLAGVRQVAEAIAVQYFRNAGEWRLHHVDAIRTT